MTGNDGQCRTLSDTVGHCRTLSDAGLDTGLDTGIDTGLDAGLDADNAGLMPTMSMTTVSGQ